ncbi:MAG: sugar transferase [Chlamydiota bacterium]
MSTRIFDIIFSLLVLVLGAPLYLLLAFSVKLSSNGPIFFVDSRVGLSGNIFHCLKFRTMYVDAPEKLYAILATNPSLQEEWNSHQKLKKDPRITSFGRLLRKSSLDELPQFINVLIGDMSVVGPRPVTEKELIDRFNNKSNKILSVKPGITGLWQVSGRSNLSYEQRLALEESYVDKKSFLLDLKIIAKTLPSIFLSKGAY